MTDTNPFKIRLELLVMAKDLLMEEYYSKKDLILEQWRSKQDSKKSQSPAPELPSFPTEKNIIEKASALNAFISSGK